MSPAILKPLINLFAKKEKKIVTALAENCNIGQSWKNKSQLKFNNIGNFLNQIFSLHANILRLREQQLLLNRHLPTQNSFHLDVLTNSSIKILDLAIFCQEIFIGILINCLYILWIWYKRFSKLDKITKIHFENFSLSLE